MTIRLVLLRSRFCFCFFLVAVAFSGVFASNGGMKMEKTLAMIKPDGLRGNYTDRIKGAIGESGFRILEERIVELDEDRASRFYAEHSSRSFFSNLVKYMTSGPVCIMVLEKQNAIADWRALIGPTDSVKAKATHPNSIRAMCGLDSEKNCVHGSDSLLSAQREISFFFEEETTVLVRHATAVTVPVCPGNILRPVNDGLQCFSIGENFNVCVSPVIAPVQFSSIP